MARTQFAGTILAALAVITAWNIPAAAADPVHLAEYKHYMRALDAGDAAAAESHAQAAWQAAERELGDHRLTAILAYNFGKLIAISRPQAALAPLRRAKELQEAGVADELPATELRLFLAYAEFIAGGETRRTAEALRAALTEAESDLARLGSDVPLMWLRLAVADHNAKRYKAALAAAEKAEAGFIETAPDYYIGRAQAILLWGAARLLPVSRRIADIEAAHDAFLRARMLFPSQASIDQFDPTLARVVAWDFVAHAALYSTGRKKFSNEPAQGQCTAECAPLIEGRQDDLCELDWDRKPPKYPRRELDQGYLGAAVIGYHLGDDGTVVDARVLAEVPQAAFGDVALKSTAEWRLKGPPPNNPACRRNLLSYFSFSID